MADGAFEFKTFITFAALERSARERGGPAVAGEIDDLARGLSVQGGDELIRQIEVPQQIRFEFAVGGGGDLRHASFALPVAEDIAWSGPQGLRFAQHGAEDPQPDGLTNQFHGEL